MMLMCYIDILNYFLRYNRSILNIVLLVFLGYAMCYDGIAKCTLSIPCDARRIGRLLGYTMCYTVTIMVLLCVCLVLIAMLDASADF
jgi:hypothetical protein